MKDRLGRYKVWYLRHPYLFSRIFYQHLAPLGLPLAAVVNPHQDCPRKLRGLPRLRERLGGGQEAEYPQLGEGPNRQKGYI